MKTIKLSLISTTFVAALSLAFWLMGAPALAGPPDEQGCHLDHKPCGGDGGSGGEDPIVYTAKLTMGAFEFMCDNCDMGEVVVTPNNRETVLRSNVVLDMVRPPITDSNGYDTWNEVFNACEELLGLDMVESFSVGRDDWTIDKAGGVRVVFRDIELRDMFSNVIEAQGAEFRVQLIGDEFDFVVPFLPELEEMTEHVLTQFAITGTPARGMGAIKSCRGSAGAGLLGFIDGSGTFIQSPSTLVITASVPE